MGPIKRQNYDSVNRTYTIVINKFTSKMSNWNIRRKIYSNEFEVDGQEFTIDVFPNYENDHVGVFLNNVGCDNVVVSAKFTIDDVSESIQSSTIEADKGWGVPDFFPHSNATFKTDEMLKLEVEFSEVKMSNVALRDYLDCLNSKIDQHSLHSLDFAKNKPNLCSLYLHFHRLLVPE